MEENKNEIVGQTDNSKTKKIGAFLGQAVATVIAACLTSVIIAATIALTIKFISWLF